MCVFRSRYEFFGPQCGGDDRPTPPVDPPLSCRPIAECGKIICVIEIAEEC